MYYVRVGGQYIGGSAHEVRWVDGVEQAAALTIGGVLRQITQICDPESNLNHLTITISPVNRMRENQIIQAMRDDHDPGL